jgi:hypothetical protein
MVYPAIPQHGIHELTVLLLMPKPSHVVVCDMENAFLVIIMITLL